MKKRMITLLLTLVMILTVAAPANAVENAGSGTCGDGLTWTLADGTLTISGIGAMADYAFTWDENDVADGTNAPWFGMAFTTLVIEEGVTSVGENAFYNCAGLTSMVLPSTLETIGSYAFGFCTDLQDAALPEGLTGIDAYGFYASGVSTVCIPKSLRTLGDWAFAWCENLSAITVAEGSRHFSSDGIGLYDVTGTQLIQLPAGYQGSYTLASTCLEVWDYGVFDGCLGVTSITIPAATNYLDSGLFRNCLGLKEIRVAAGNEVYYDVNGALYDRDWNALVAVAPACDAEEFYVAEGIETVGGWAFANCANIREVYIPTSVSSLYAYIFDNCTALEHIWVDEDNEYFLSDEDGVVFNRAYEDYDYYDLDSDGDTDEVMTIPEKAELIQFPTGVTGYYAVPDGVQVVFNSSFSTCSLEAIRFPATVRVMHWWSLDFCENLEWVVFTGDKPITEEYCFDHTTATVYYPGWNSTWDDPEFIDCGGDLTYVPYDQGQEPVYPGMEPASTFTDVPADAYYYDAVEWAVKNGITSGTTDTTFSPFDKVERCQMVTFLWRAAGCPEPASTENPFTDVNESHYFYKAVLWAVEQGITTGTTETTFSPFAKCERCQVITFLYRAMGRPEVTSDVNPFADVNAKDYYCDAVLWAVEQGITTGTSDTTFSPFSLTERCQAVTFLYRAYN